MPVFTFHYAKIKTSGKLAVTRAFAKFTFHYAKIKTKYKTVKFVKKSIYIPLCKD